MADTNYLLEAPLPLGEEPTPVLDVVPGGTLLEAVPPGVLVTPFVVPVWF
jgi:hypothetical protein